MKFLKEPLVHFLIIGAALFALSALSSPEQPLPPSGNRIVVSEGQVRHLATVFEKSWQRPPEPDELEALVDDFLIEEASYREARRLGLDRDDTMIRRRLRQKLEFLAEDPSANPTDKTLETYLAEHRELFQFKPTFTFRQLYFRPDLHGEDPAAAIAALAASLRQGKTVAPDDTTLPERLENATSTIIDANFGDGFTERISSLPPGEWSGPIPSATGLHLVQLESSTPARLPALSEIRPQVLREWRNETRKKALESFHKQLLEQFEIVIKWPESSGDAPSQ